MVAGDADVAIERLGETLTPVLDPWGSPERLYLLGEWLCAGRADVGAGGAGFRSLIILENPANSRYIATVDQVYVQGSAGAVMFLAWLFDLQLGAEGGGTAFLDSRRQRNTNIDTVLQLRVRNNAADTANQRLIRDLANAAGTPVWSPTRIILRPGSAVYLKPGADNVAISGGFEWRERAALPGELD